jgi:inner membrane protein
MATIISHPAAALGLFPWFKPLHNNKYVLLTGMILTALPDLDVIGLRLGIPYHHMLGHRGLTHSILFAMVFCAALAWVFSARKKIAKLPLWLYFTASMASHGLLDAMTTGGLGVAFFAPFNNQRFFLPWRPIKVSTLNMAHFFHGQGVGVLKSELLFIWPPAIALFLLGILVFRKQRRFR